MEEIPISFEHKGKKYSGHFIKVRAADGKPNWLLRINSSLKGSLQFHDHIGWIFFEEIPTFAELVDYFADYLITWYDGLTK